MPDENGDPYGYELLFAVGTITTLDSDDDDEVEEPPFPFGFHAPPPSGQPPDMPELTSHDWAAWLGTTLGGGSAT